MISDLPTQPAPPTVASFFDGIGGFERAGFETVWQCEVKPFCLEKLEQHGVPAPVRVGRRETAFGAVYAGSTPAVGAHT